MSLGDKGSRTAATDLSYGEADVMHIEDDAASAAGFVSQTKLIGIRVDLVEDIVDARALLKETRYRLLVVDLEVLDSGRRRLGAGAQLITEVLQGLLGVEHKDTPIIVHTAHLGYFEESGLSDLTHVELIRKPASVYSRALEIVRPPGDEVVLVEVLPLSESAAEHEGVLVRIPGWRNEEFEVPMAMFDGGQLTDIALAEEELYFSGLIDLDADTPQELGLRIMEAVPPAQPEETMWGD